MWRAFSEQRNNTRAEMSAGLPSRRATADQSNQAAPSKCATTPTVKHRRLGVRFPKAKLNTPSTAAELVKHNQGRASVHGVVPIEPTKRIEPSERARTACDTANGPIERAWAAPSCSLHYRRSSSSTRSNN